MDGNIEAGPNAVLAFAREGYRKLQFDLKDSWEMVSYPGFWRMAQKYWRQGFQEYYRSLNKLAFVRTLQKLVPSVTSSDLMPGDAGVRAMALHQNGDLLDDFYITRNKMLISVLNAPSPAATSSFAIADHIIGLA
jgi:L-2-hydroxyglutarate oxidase LhgO